MSVDNRPIPHLETGPILAFIEQIDPRALELFMKNLADNPKLHEAVLKVIARRNLVLTKMINGAEIPANSPDGALIDGIVLIVGAALTQANGMPELREHERADFDSIVEQSGM